MKLLENEIEELDYLVNLCNDKGCISTYDLKVPGSIGDPPKDTINIDRWISNRTQEYYYKYYVILDEYNKRFDFLNIELSGTYFDAQPKIPNTQKFIDSGGFKKLFKDQQKEIEHQELLKEKDKIEVEILKFNRDKQKITFWLAIASIILSALAIGISIYSMFKSQN